MERYANYDFDLVSLQRIEIANVKTQLSNKKGIYFWFFKLTDKIVYIGIGIGTGGLKKRIVSQHLNAKYIEFRTEKHTHKDEYQLAHAIPRLSKNNKTTRLGIDKSALRKAIGRRLDLKPGTETVDYILDNLYLKVFETDDSKMIKALEIQLIKQFKPLFNSFYNPKDKQQEKVI